MDEIRDALYILVVDTIIKNKEKYKDVIDGFIAREVDSWNKRDMREFLGLKEGKR